MQSSTTEMLKISLSLLFLIIQVESYLNEYVRYFETLEYNNNELMDNHHRSRRSQFTNGDTLKLSFNAFQMTFDLSLQPDSRYNDYKLVVNGKPHSKHLANSLYYTGYDTSDPTGTYVHGSLAFGVFDGAIHGRDEVYYIEPSNRYFSNVSHHSIIYRQSDAIHKRSTSLDSDHGSFCGVKSISRIQSINTRAAYSRKAREDIVVDKTKRKCDLKVLIDELFYEAVTDSRSTEMFRIAQAIATVKDIILAGSNNFAKTDFDKDGNPDGIHFGIRTLEILTNNSLTDLPIKDKYLGVDALLVAFSKDDYNDYCLSYLFTYREFQNGVLGLAYVADNDSAGGICDKRRKLNDERYATYNTGLVTLSNYGRRITQLVAHVTFTHEAGHNFGSNHDPERCAPGDGNNYVMFSKTSQGKKSNNNRFSNCSITEMAPLVHAKGQSATSGCFTQAGDNCGNQLTDPNEDCDCGNEFDIRTSICLNDPCCNGTSCRLADTAECSPQQGPCCNDTCQLFAMFDDVICSETTDCSYNQTCNGSSVACPEPDPIESFLYEYGIPCNDGRNYCVETECSGSLCVPLQLTDCECTEDRYLCHVCCRLGNGTCASTIALAEQNETAKSILPDGRGAVVGVGYPCNVSQGYCDFFDVCRLVDSEGPLKRITNFVKGIINVSKVFSLNYIQRYWWAYIIAMVVIALVVFGLVYINHMCIKRPKHIQQRIDRRKRAKSRKVKVQPLEETYF